MNSESVCVCVCVQGLDALVRSKELELERTLETCRKLEWMKQQSDEKHTLAVRERDGVIQRLQTALHTHSKETEVNTHARLVPDINTDSRKLEPLVGFLRARRVRRSVNGLTYAANTEDPSVPQTLRLLTSLCVYRSSGQCCWEKCLPLTCCRSSRLISL